MANRKEVARIAGVSTATVTRVTSGKGYVAPKTREKIVAVIEQLNYKPNTLAQNLRMRKSNGIAVFVEDLQNPYIAECVEIMTKEAKARGYIVMLFTITVQNVKEVAEEVLENNIMGVINLALVDIGAEEKRKFTEKGIRMINIMENGLTVHIDYEPAMRAVFRILRDQGKRHPVFIGGMGREWMLGDNRIRSFLKLNREFGMSGGENEVIAGNYPAERYMEIGYRRVGEMIAQGTAFDAVFCITDALAMGVLKALAESGKRVPEDVAVIGCDNVSMASMTNPGLTTFDGRIETISKEYIRYILSDELISEKHYESRLIARGTL